MNHAGMDHGDMGHGDHGGMEDMCSMSMLFTWDTTNLCIVFRQWHIRSMPGLIFSLAAVVLLAMGYEALRALSRRFEASVDRRMSALPRKFHSHLCSSPSPPFLPMRIHIPELFNLIASYFPHAHGICANAKTCVMPRGDEQDAEITPLLAPGSSHPDISKQGHFIKAVFYGVQTFYAFMLMLVFMTYNGWVMLAVSLGAFLGYLFFGHCTSATKDNACH